MEIKLSFFALLAQSLLAMASPSSTNLTPRQYWGFGAIDEGSCCTGDCVYSPVGDGNPHQDYYHYQVSEHHQCADEEECAASALESHTFGWSFSGGATANGWVSAGFDVSESWTSGNTYTCNGNPGDRVCVWVKVAHTAYTVDLSEITNGVDSTCSTQDFGPLVMESPNVDNAGGGYYCVYGDACRDINDGYWCYSYDPDC